MLKTKRLSLTGAFIMSVSGCCGHKIKHEKIRLPSL
nr:MAG TPA: hypothetical protein [Caudoviricetes sp.]